MPKAVGWRTAFGTLVAEKSKPDKRSRLVDVAVGLGAGAAIWLGLGIFVGT